jgi:hypothetical protein
MVKVGRASSTALRRTMRPAEDRSKTHHPDMYLSTLAIITAKFASTSFS